MGDGFAVAAQFGHETRDELTTDGFLANHAGGILGGISSGQDIRVAIALKPTASITTPGKTINLNREDTGRINQRYAMTLAWVCVQRQLQKLCLRLC